MSNNGGGSQASGRGRQGGQGRVRGRGGNYYRGRGRCGGWRGYHGNTGGRNSNYSSNRGPASSTRHADASIVEAVTPYKGWRYYFTDEGDFVYNYVQKGYSEHSPMVAQVKAFEKFFASKMKIYDKDEIERKGSITVDYKELLEDDVVSETLPDLRTDIKDLPEKTLNCLGLAIHQMLTRDLEHQATVLQHQASGESGQPEVDVPSILVSVPIIRARLVNYEPLTPLKNLKANYYGKFVSVRGTVVRVSNIKPFCTKMAFQCNMCGDIQIVNLPEGRYTLPTKCLAPDCRGRSFAPKQSSPLTETVDWQMVKVQEIMLDGQRESGRIPRTVECELTCDLVDSCVPGDVVTIGGVVKVSNIDEGHGRNKDKCMFLLYLHANSVQNQKRSKKAAVTGEGSPSGMGLATDFTLKELYAIQEIQDQTNLFRLIVGSLCPAIYGHEMVKAGLILGLFGGTHRFVNDKNRIPVRGDPHILVVGDPGLGKSQMLQAASNVAPRGVYVCGNTTTTSGLTVTLSKEGGSGDYALEAGALVLGDQGCCCIDEFDKMGNQHQALLEAMEQQSISIAKSGVVCSLPARTSILAAANPVGGHYNKAKTVSENLKMGSALLSRFDLVFILLDKPDEEMDSLLSEHVMALHAGRKRATEGAHAALDDQATTPEQTEAPGGLWESDRPLSERLKVGRGEAFDAVPPQLIRKYIAYARKYVHPKLSRQAATVLQNFYLELRRQHKGRDSTPITTRQLESLIRLTEARARLELREKADEQDAVDVVELMKFSMIDTYSDEFGFLDFQRSQHGCGMSSRSKAKRFVAVLNRVAEQTYNSLFSVQQMRDIARDANISIPDFEGFVASLNNQNYLLKKGPRVYQLQTASC